MGNNKRKNTTFRLPQDDLVRFNVCLALKSQSMQEVLYNNILNYIKECEDEYGNITLENILSKNIKKIIK